MKWISELQSSLRLDAQPIEKSAGTRNPQSQRGRKGSVEEVHEKLCRENPKAAAPEILHHSIITAVRRLERAQGGVAELDMQTKLAFWPRFAATSGLAAVLVLAGVLLLAHRPGPRSPSADLQQQLMALPDKAVSPLSTELESLQQDLQRTTTFLMASVPEIDN